MPAGTVVGVKETLDAVDKGLIDCGFAWTHYWSGEHPGCDVIWISSSRCRCWYRQNSIPIMVLYQVVEKSFMTNYGKK